MDLPVTRRQVWLALAEADAALISLEAVDAGNNLAGLYAGGLALTLAYEELRKADGDLARAYATCMDFVCQSYGWTRNPVMITVFVPPGRTTSSEDDQAALQRGLSHAAAYAMNVGASRGSAGSLSWRQVAGALAEAVAQLEPRTTSAEKVIGRTEGEG